MTADHRNRIITEEANEQAALKTSQFSIPVIFSPGWASFICYIPPSSNRIKDKEVYDQILVFKQTVRLKQLTSGKE